MSPGVTRTCAPTITAPLGSTTVTRSVASARVCANPVAAESAIAITSMDPPDLLRCKGVRLERRVDPNRLARRLFDRLAVDRSREMMRELHPVHGLVVVDEERDVHRLRLRRRQRGGGVARRLLGAAHPLGIRRPLHRLR